MTHEEAYRIIHVWGFYSEYAQGMLMHLFRKIPESVLPYSKKIIEEATNIVAKDQFDNGNKDAVNKLQELQILLEFYIDDDKALSETGVRYSTPEERKRIIEAIVEFRKEWQGIVEKGRHI